MKRKLDHMILEAVVVCEGKVYGEKDSLSISLPISLSVLTVIFQVNLG